jgi:uncharacterized membrane protein YuzA (DUF378 family)
MAKEMKWYDWVAFTLLVIGGLNWGLGLFNVNLVSLIFGTGLLAKVVYGAVGVSGAYGLYMIVKLASK